MGMHRFVVGFGFEYDRDGGALFLTADDVTRLVERVAAEVKLPAYTLRFGPGSWTNDNGVRVHEQGGTVEFVADHFTEPTAREFAAKLRYDLRQDSVVFYYHPVASLKFI